MNKNQDGFSAVELLLIIITVSLIAFAAFYVGSRQSEKSPEKTEATITQASKTEAPTTTFTDQDGLYSFQLPNDWVAEYLDNDKGFLTLRPRTFKAPGQENNWVVGVFVSPLPGSYASGEQFATFDEFKSLKLEQSADPKRISKDLVINGVPVWKYSETIKDGSPTGPPEFSGGYQDFSYYYHKEDKRIISVEMRTYQHATTNYQGTKINESYNYTKYIPQFETIVKSFKLN
jgi:hypothetical protein